MYGSHQAVAAIFVASAPSLHKCHKALLFIYFMVYKISLNKTFRKFGS
jgi:hypothetical protein